MDKIAFKKGLLLALAENGITGSDLGRYCLEKEARLPVPFVQIPTPGKLIGGAVDVATALPVAAVMGGGLGAGWLASKLTNPKVEDEVAKLKRETLLKELAFQNENIRRRLKEKSV